MTHTYKMEMLITVEVRADYLDQAVEKVTNELENQDKMDIEVQEINFSDLLFTTDERELD